MEHSKHLWRAAVLVLLGIAGFVVVRLIMIPESFGLYGPYRADDVQRQMSKPLVHSSGNEACGPCHAEMADAVASGKHLRLTCEGCHAPLVDHVKGKTKIADMRKERDMLLCLRCHQHTVARPASFPQVDIEAHLKEMEVELVQDVCFGCHDPHSPEM